MSNKDQEDKGVPLTIVHSNELIEAGYHHTTDEMRMLNLGLTKIDSRKGNPGDIDIYPSEFAEMYGLNERNVWRNMKKALKNIMTKPIKLYTVDEKNKEKVIMMSWLVKSEYYSNQDDGSKITIQFSPTITPYLFELKNRFTALDFVYASKLNTHFAYRLYTWLMKYKFLENYKKGSNIVVELEIDWMKSRAGIAGSYERWDKFRSQIIEPSVEQINSKTDISIIWTPKKRGKAIKSIEFSYILEKALHTAPIRPRLKRRPKVEAGSHAEGEWMRTNLNILMKYKKDLYEYDSRAKIDMNDVNRILEYSKKTGQLHIFDEITKYKNERIEKSKRRKKD